MAATALASSPAFSFEEDHDLPPCPWEASHSYVRAADGCRSSRLSGEFTHNTLVPVDTNMGRSMRKKIGAHGELDVFDAEKYFTGNMDGDEQLVTKPENKPWMSPSPSREIVFPSGKTSLSGTPSASSETSRHTNSNLLQNPKTECSANPQRSPQAAGGKKFLGIFPCPCVDNSSMETTDHLKSVRWPETRRNEKTMWRRRTGNAGCGLRQEREDCSDFPPVLKPLVVRNPTDGEELFREERKGRRIPSSMDVFNSPSLRKVPLGASSLRWSLTMSPAFTGGIARDSDVCSESSSDLFEIEHLAAGSRTLGTNSTTSATPCDEPIEASIEWSIATASAANFFFVSDVDWSPREARKAKERQQHQRPGGLLLGCGRGEAVRISSNTCKFQANKEAAEHRQHNMSTDGMPVVRQHALSPPLVDYDQRRGEHISMARGAFLVQTPCRHCPP